MILVVLLLIVFTFSLGRVFLFVTHFPKTKSIFLLVGLSFGVGVIAIILEMFIFSALRLPFNRITLLLPFVIFSVVIFRQNILKFRRLQVVTLPKGLPERVLVMLIVILVIFVCIQALMRPPIGWDALATWLLQAKSYYYLGGVESSFYQYTKFDAPPGLGLLVSFYYFNLGQVDDNLILLLFPAFYIAILCTLYGTIKEYTNQKTAIVFVFLFASTQSVIRQAGRFEAGYADLSLSYFFFISGYLLLRFSQSKNHLHLLYASLFVGTSLLIKNEGSSFFLLFNTSAVYIIIKHKNYSALFNLLPGVVIFFAWSMYASFMHLSPSYLSEGSLNISRIPVVVLGWSSEFANVIRWNFLWIVFFFVLLFFSKRFKRIPIGLFLGQLSIYFIVFLFTPLDPAEQIIGSFDRLLLQLAPLAYFSLALACYGILKKSYLSNSDNGKVSRTINARNSRRSS